MRGVFRRVRQEQGLFGGSRKRLEKRAQMVPGLDPASAAHTVIRDVVIPYARNNGASHVAATLGSLGPEECFRRFDKILSEVCESIAGKRLAQTGEGGSMANAYFNQAYEPVTRAIERYTL
jgi:hypothetical protein